MPKKGFIPNKLRPWIEARKKYNLSHSHIQMARELGLNPKKFGSLGNTKQQQWKLPLPEFIEKIYFKHFKKTAPDNVKSIEQVVKEKARKKADKRIQSNKRTIMNEEPNLETSPLSQIISSGGRTVSIEIYRLEGETSWALEVVDEYNNSTVWDDTFETDSAALTEAKKTILAEGVGSLIGPEDGKSGGSWK